MISRWLLLVSCLLLALVAQPSTAKKSDPKITATRFDHEPSNLFYFEDSDTIIFQDIESSEVYKSVDGGEKWEVVDDEDGKMKGHVWMVWPHPSDKTKAYVLGTQGRHWVTTDQAKTWRPFQLDVLPSLMRSPLSFHGLDSKKVIFHGEECAGFRCFQRTFYTRDDFATISSLRDGTHGCSWAVGQPEFARDLDVIDEIENRIFCIVPGLKVPYAYGNRFIYSDDYFQTDKEGVEVKLDQGRPITGIINTAAVKKYLVAAAKSQGTDELALYVTDDTKVWHRAEFGKHKLEEDAYTVLESTNYSIQVDVLTTGRTSPMGVLFTSNSNGTYFTRNIEHTNRNIQGLVDFEKIANIQGIVLVNIVDNWEEVEKAEVENKKVVSKISFDDGHTFQSLKVGDKPLHLHSVTAFANIGRVFSSPAPGIVMGVGNTGDHLKSYADGDLYVSDDAGVTWRKALDGSHKYEFGDQGAVIMAVHDKNKADKIQFSINHGKEWETAELEHKIQPRLLTTTPDSTSLKFLLIGSVKGDVEDKWIIYSIDFEGLHERKCGKDDFEKWPARLDENGEPDCLMGHKQFYRRRKADADCFIDEEFKDPDPIFEPCKCTVEDFECDYNFVRSEDRKNCIPAAPLVAPKGECKKPSDKYVGPSGWRLIPGDSCIRDGGENLDKEVERPCDEAAAAPNGAVSATKQLFEAPRFSEFYYLERAPTSGGDDETIIMNTSDGELFITHDHGKHWERALEGSKIIELAPHRYFNDHAFFITDSKKAFWTVDRGYHLSEFEVPNARNKDRLPSLTFHPQYKDWLIWTGSSCTGGDCHSVASISKNRGAKWDLLLRGVRKCDFMARDDRADSENLIFCEQFENENPDNALQLIASDNWFYENKVHFTNVVDFATMAEFIIVAARNPKEEQSLKVDTSVDAKIFADAEFPSNLNVPVQKAYTVLESSTHSVFLHVTVNNMEGHAYGSIIKSNSNGTSYVLSVDAVNRNDNGYVDFEKMQGLEGVAIVNVVGNVKESEKGQAKRLRSMVTHNDGAQWALLPPPSKNSEGKNYGCKTKDGQPTDKCALHLHGYTERRDPRATYASASAIGLMMGVGNVGEYLTSKEDGETFITRDGGITWRAVKKGSYLWEYGDQGSVIVIVEEAKPTKVIYYSVDEGETWEEYQFTDVDMQVDAISTVPSDTSRNFLLWGRETGNKNKLATVNLDFSGLRDRLCNLNEDSGENEDYYFWEPKHPLQENNCLFGHVEQYHRKKPSAHCWNDWKQPHIHRIAQNCTCTREDYEW